MNKQTVKDIDIQNKRVLMRVDYNVPLDENLSITDDARIVKSLDTVKYILSQNAKLILMSHLGRPKGPDAKSSLKPAADRLSKLIGKNVVLASDSIGSDVEAKVNALKGGEVLMLENLRFHAEEEKNDAAFAKKLASYGEVYVNDAFGTAHRAHASTEGVTKFIPTSVAGFLLAKEVEYFEKVVSNPDRPFVTILGGAKVSDKIKLIKNLLNKADVLLVGGAMAYTFYKVLGIGIGNSKFDPAGMDAAKEALELSKQKGVPIILPVDRVIAEKMEKGTPTKIVNTDIPDGWSGFDIGPESAKKFKEVLAKAKTILWNGPLGLFEIQPFDKGTREIAEYIATLKATSIIGGGDTAAAITKFGLEDKMSHVSTGGGASLEYLEGTVLPGVAALKDKKAVHQ
jgi:3-phosphoglycerate kinase